MNTASLRTALIAAVIVAIGAFALFSIGSATAQQACIQPLTGNGTYNGTWDNTCLSENTPLGDYSYPTGTRYARFYTFTLSETSTVTVELQSSADTYVYLMQGKGKTGTILHYNDDITRNENTNSRISQSLSAGDYTIEATTYDVEQTGNFTLVVSGLPAASTPTITPTSGAGDAPTVTPTHTPTATATSVSGQVPPTITPTSTATPTPTQTSGPSNVLNRLTALETRAATQQGLIATMESKIIALDGRVATLEADASKPMPTVTNTPTPRPTPVAAFTGRSIFQEIDRLGANEFNRRYSGKFIEISAYWSGYINPPAGTSGPLYYYGVAVIEKPSEELVFIWTSASGIWWTYSYTEPHDGKIIVGAGTGSLFASTRTYTCKVDEYATGTLDLTSCKRASATSNENSKNIPARVFESYSSGGHK